MKQWIKFISVLALCLMSANTWGRHPQDIKQEAIREILEQRKLEDYPGILGLTQEEIVASREINLRPKIRAMAKNLFRDLEEMPVQLKPRPKGLEKRTATREKVVGLTFGISQGWAVNHGELMDSFYQNLGLEQENRFFYFGNGDEQILNGNMINRDAFTKENFSKSIKQIAQDSEVTSIVLSMHGHGGSILRRIGKNFGYSCTPSICIDKDNPNHQRLVAYNLESKIGWGILRAPDWNRVLVLEELSPAYSWIRIDENGKQKFGFLVTKYTTGYFSENSSGVKISPIVKHTYFFSWADSLGEVDDTKKIIPRDPYHPLNPDLAYIKSYPETIEEALIDIDVNGIDDIPVALINAKGDTIIGVCMNLEMGYTIYNSDTNGRDLDKDGFIGDRPGEHLDLNKNGQDDQVYIPTQIKIQDNEFLYDLELQTELQQIPEDVTLVVILHFCHSGGFGNYLPAKQSIFFASVPQDFSALGTGYPLDVLVMGASVKEDFLMRADMDSDGSLCWLELFNWTRHGEGWPRSQFSQYWYLLLLCDNQSGKPAHGPWPNNTQGYLAEDILVCTQSQVTGVESKEMLPFSFNLFQNFPNPFNPTTTITYSLSKPGHVSLVIYDMQGRQVITLVDDFQNIGNYSIEFNASHLPSGIYFCQLLSGGKIFTKKMTLLK